MTIQSLYKATLSAIAVTISIALIAPFAFADHSWGKYHWERSESELNLELGDNVSPNWDASLQLASQDWSLSNVLNTQIVAGNTNPSDCTPLAGKVEVCNYEYGSNGWLGIAQIWASRKSGHITQGAVKLNDTYYNTASYNTPEWRNFVMCQEIGHIFGLDHQDEVFGNTNLGSCMDYTNNPTTNQHPDQHDYDQLEAIYAHLDGSTAGGGGKKRPGRPATVRARADLNDPVAWGTLVREDVRAQRSLYVRDEGRDQLIFTFVTWADGEHHEHD